MSSAEPHNELPAGAWRVLGFAAVGLLAAMVALIALISAGVFDPRPAGPLQQTLAPGPLRLAAGQRALHWLPEPAPHTPFSARLLAARHSGEPDAAYGLALGHDAGAFVVAVSAAGYVSVWQESAGGERLAHMPWQTWPHVHGGEAWNEIQIDVWGEAADVRLNRELLWQGELTPAPTSLGLYAESFGAAVEFDFAALSLHYGGAP